MKSTGYILNGIYIKNDQAPGTNLSSSATYKQYDHDRQREEHRIDLIQPWVNGKPNEEFRIHYPEEAEKYYGKHQEQ